MDFPEAAYRLGWLQEAIKGHLKELDRLAADPPSKRSAPTAIRAVGDELKRSLASLDRSVAEEIAKAGGAV